MRKPRARPLETRCVDCNGTGRMAVAPSTKPGLRIYPPQCKACLGKGRIRIIAN
jgi:DnaJ-class molecular chaperone